MKKNAFLFAGKENRRIFTPVITTTNTTKMRLPNEKTATGEVITFENGRSFKIYTSMTKRGARFYYWASGRFLPISQFDINKYIAL